MLLTSHTSCGVLTLQAQFNKRMRLDFKKIYFIYTSVSTEHCCFCVTDVILTGVYAAWTLCGHIYMHPYMLALFLHFNAASKNFYPRLLRVHFEGMQLNVIFHPHLE